MEAFTTYCIDQSKVKQTENHPARINPIESAKFLRLMSNEYAFKCAFVDGSTCCSYVLKRDASHLLVIRYVPRSPMFRLLEYTQGLIVRHFDRDSTKGFRDVYCTCVKCIV